jgi:hypothetical protein
VLVVHHELGELALECLPGQTEPVSFRVPARSCDKQAARALRVEVRYGEGGGTEPYHHVVNVREHLPRRRYRVAPPSPQERRSKRAHTGFDKQQGVSRARKQSRGLGCNTHESTQAPRRAFTHIGWL